jgi:hypothetical protein
MRCSASAYTSACTIYASADARSVAPLIRDRARLGPVLCAVPGLQRKITLTYCLDPMATGTRVVVGHEGFTGRSHAAEEHAQAGEFPQSAR